jgi:hypothetical protein
MIQTVLALLRVAPKLEARVVATIRFLIVWLTVFANAIRSGTLGKQVLLPRVGLSRNHGLVCLADLVELVHSPRYPAQPPMLLEGQVLVLVPLAQPHEQSDAFARQFGSDTASTWRVPN